MQVLNTEGGEGGNCCYQPQQQITTQRLIAVVRDEEQRLSGQPAACRGFIVFYSRRPY